MRTIYPFRYASLAATFPSHTVNTSTPRRCHGWPFRTLRYIQRTTVPLPLTQIACVMESENSETPETTLKNKLLAEFVEIAIERVKDYGLPSGSISCVHQ